MAEKQPFESFILFQLAALGNLCDVDFLSFNIILRPKFLNYERNQNGAEKFNMAITKFNKCG